MSTNNGNGLQLAGVGGSYLRVSGDRQEFQRQQSALADFEQRHRVRIPQHHRFEDDMPRDLSAKRPDFQRMLKAARAGSIKWIFVDQIDRFGFADEWELADLLGQLRKAGCRLFDARDEDWTAHGLMSFFKAGLAGHSSHDEQVKKSWRSLGGMIQKAKAGEWQGGPPKLGFDLGCFDRATGKELWRVVFEGRDKVGTTKRKGKERPIYHIRRLKVYPDGKTERLDGNVIFRTFKDIQLMRIVPTHDEAKLAAVKGVFERYASQAVTFFDLAKRLNRLGTRNSFGKLFQARDISKMLMDEAYLGYPCFSKRRAGRFHRVKEGGILELEAELKGKDTESNPEDIIRSEKRLFDPLIDRPTWDKVQKKLRGRPKKNPAPKNPDFYLAGLVVCAGCGRPMIARSDRMEYYCGTWDKHRVRGTLEDSPCERNGVRQAVLEEYIAKYLDETGKRLEMLKSGIDPDKMTQPMTDRLLSDNSLFVDRFMQLLDYIQENDPKGFKEMWQGIPEAHEPDIETAADYYRRCFDPQKIDERLKDLEAQHDTLTEQALNVKTERAVAKVNQKLAALEADIKRLEEQKQNLADITLAQWKEIEDLAKAIDEAKEAMESEAGAHALRQKAEALRAILCRIDCEFALTGKKSSGPGQSSSRLVALTFLPIAGESMRIEASLSQAAPEANGRQVSHGKP
jgi:DNA invertase Pin-like site-specific DNA recombinase